MVLNVIVSQTQLQSYYFHIFQDYYNHLLFSILLVLLFHFIINNLQQYFHIYLLFQDHESILLVFFTLFQLKLLQRFILFDQFIMDCDNCLYLVYKIIQLITLQVNHHIRYQLKDITILLEYPFYFIKKYFLLFSDFYFSILDYDTILLEE